MIIYSRAPNRILDFGGWTDTHFAGSGRLLNFAIQQYAHVTIRTNDSLVIQFRILDYGEKVNLELYVREAYGPQGLLFEAVRRVGLIGQGMDIDVTADVPPGCGTGSSAAVSVALLRGLLLLKGEVLSHHQVVKLAHMLETVDLGLECGVQDQISAAYGGVNYIEIEEYPKFQVSDTPLSDSFRVQLESQLVLVYSGKAHISSEVHKEVISSLADNGSHASEALSELKLTADVARQAIANADAGAFGKAMSWNNELQKRLHPGISTGAIEKAEDVGASHGILGSMINGAGGGGSLCLLCSPGKRTEIVKALKEEGYTILPSQICMETSLACEIK